MLPYVWDAAACGLEGPDAGRLGVLVMGTETHHGGNPSGGREPGSTRAEGSAAPTTYLVREPVYIPYRSKGVPRYESSDRMCLRVLEEASRVGHDTVMASPVIATALVVAAEVRRGLWAGPTTPAGRAVAALTGVAPPKGNEIVRELAEYCVHNADTPQAAAPMAIRDFFGSVNAWQFIRGDGRLLDLSGSVLCITMVPDYVGAPDDSGGGAVDAYIAASSEGVACLGGIAADQALRDIMTVCAVISARETAMQASGAITDLDAFLSVSGEPITPREFMWARWWDASMVPYYRLIMSTAGYRHLTDEFGTFTAFDTCGAARRAVDGLIRYNEVVDIVSDLANKECFNEALLALTMSGPAAIFGYGDALARITDDVLDCACGASGHDEAAEMAMGTCLWFLLGPRYRARDQLSAFCAAGGALEQAYRWRPPGARLEKVARTELAPGQVLHSDTWQPLWSLSRKEPCERENPWAEDLARLVVRRSVLDEAGQDKADRCRAAARSVLADCDTLSDAASLRALSGKWCHVFDTALGADGAATSVPDLAVTAELRALLSRIWQHTVVVDESTDPDIHRMEQLFLDTDRAVRRTYELPPPQGLALRRAFFGVVSSAIELSGLNPYERLTDGASMTMSHHTWQSPND